MVGRRDIRLWLLQFVPQIKPDLARLLPGKTLGDTRIGRRPHGIGRISTRQVGGYF
jgi:hypothetical protein